MKDKLNQPIFINVTMGTIFKAFFAIFLVYALFVLRDLILVLLTSVILASGIEPITKWLMRRRIPRALSVLMIYVAVLVFLTAIFYVFAPPFVKDLQNFATSFPKYLVTANESGVGENFPVLNQVIEKFNNLEKSELIATISGNSNTTAGFVSTLSIVFGGIFSGILIFIISFYLAVQENGISALIRIVTPLRHEKYAIDLWQRSQKKIGLWVQGQLLLSVIVGILTFLGLSILGVKNAMMLSVLAGVLELIPIFGPFLAGIPAVILSFLDGGITSAFLIIGLYVIIQQFESQLIHPQVVKKIVGIPALVAILSLIIGAKIAGFLGILIAVPVAAAIMEYLSDVEKDKALASKMAEQN